MDPTIPRHSRRGTPALTYGRIVDLGDRLVLTDRHSNTWPMDRVNWAISGYGSVNDGVVKLPRTWLYETSSSQVIRQGDTLILGMIDGKAKRVAVLGFARNVDSPDFLPYNYDRNNDEDRLAGRFRKLTNNVETARVDFEVHDTEGHARLGATDQAELGVAADLDNGVRTRVVVTRTKVQAKKAGEAKPLVQQSPYLADEAKGLAAVVAVLGALGLPVTDLASFVTKSGTDTATSVYSTTVLEGQ